MIRKTPFVEGEIYHIYNRGNGKNNIFIDNSDRERFLRMLYICNSTEPVVYRLVQGLPLDEIVRGDSLVDIGAYVLMPNHFHILIREKSEKGISMFMEKLSTGYSMYFNKKYERTGGLFEGRFKSRHVDNEPYLNYLLSYIHLNPVKLIDPTWKDIGIRNPEQVRQFLNKYKYSSYDDYFIGKRTDSLIINKQAFPEDFLFLNDPQELINSWEDTKGTALCIHRALGR